MLIIGGFFVTFKHQREQKHISSMTTGSLFYGNICILVEIELQVYICVPKVRFIGPTVSFFFIFCDLLDGTRKSRGDAKLYVVTRTLRGTARQRNSFEFFLSNASITIFFLTEL